MAFKAASLVRMKQFATSLPLLAMLAACAAPTEEKPDEAPSGSTKYTAELIASGTGDGGPVGDALLNTGADGTKLTLSLADIKAGSYGMHLHETGRCEAPDFKSAGGHWNPAGKEHGIENPKGAHAGDLPNLEVKADGVVEEKIHLPSLKFDEGDFLDTDGAAFVIHAGPDDNMTDPSGDSGGRIICGVFIFDGTQDLHIVCNGVCTA